MQEATTNTHSPTEENILGGAESVPQGGRPYRTWLRSYLRSFLAVDAGVRVNVVELFCRHRQNQVVTVRAGSTSKRCSKFSNSVLAGAVLRPSRGYEAFVLVRHTPYYSKPRGKK